MMRAECRMMNENQRPLAFNRMSRNLAVQKFIVLNGRRNK
jgi:hypothetical protein